jgi:hypothetical protein
MHIPTALRATELTATEMRVTEMRVTESHTDLSLGWFDTVYREDNLRM